MDTAPMEQPNSLFTESPTTFSLSLPRSCRFYERALQAAPEDTGVMDALGELLLGLGEGERAFEVRRMSMRRRGGMVPWGSLIGRHLVCIMHL